MGKQCCCQIGPKGTIKKLSNIGRYNSQNNTELNASPNNTVSPPTTMYRNKQNTWETLASALNRITLYKSPSTQRTNHFYQQNKSLSNKKTRQKRVSNRELNSITGNLFPLDSKKHGVDTLGGEATEARKNQLEGNRLLPIAKIKNAVESTLTCSKCLQSKDKNNLELFFSEINNLILPDDSKKNKS